MVISRFFPILSSRCGSPRISVRYDLTLLEQIRISFATNPTDRILRALCIHEKCVSLSRYFVRHAITIFSPSVESRPIIFHEFFENILTLSGVSIASHVSRTNSHTSSLMILRFFVCRMRFILASTYSSRSLCQLR